METTQGYPKNKSRRFANISLGVMAAGFFATLPFEQTTTLKLIQGGFEAGLVGGLADWFAVTALFRHPLNLKIPHTALLPKNREKMTQAILTIAEKELLNKESIMKKISTVSLTPLILGKCVSQLEKESTKETVKQGLQYAFYKVDQQAIATLARQYIGDALAHIETKKVVRVVVDQIVEKQYDEKLFDVVLSMVEKKVSTRETKQAITEFILETMEKKAERGFLKLAFKPLVALGRDRLTTMIEKTVDEVMADLKNPKSTNRKQILHYIQKELLAFSENEEILAQIDEKKEQFQSEEAFIQFTNYTVAHICKKIETYVTDDQFIEGTLLPKVKETLNKLKENPVFIEKTENALQQNIGTLIEDNHAKIGGLIKENLDKLNNDELTDLLENKIGKELAWIRVNGSLCGFAIGLVLTTVKLLIM